jgi:hypothetical protein
MGVMSAVLEVAIEASAAASANCTTHSQSSEAVNVHRMLETWPETPAFSIYAVEPGGERRARSIGRYAEGRVALNQYGSPEVTDSAGDNSICEQCTCVNMSPSKAMRPALPKLNTAAWVIALLTIAVVGIATAIFFAANIVVKSCSEVTDGSQSLSVLLLLCVCMALCCVVPHCLRPDALVCALRLHVTGVVMAALFAVLLSRSLMLATADLDGLPGHVSGFVQAVLFVLLVAIQAGLSVQEWFIRQRPYTERHVMASTIEMRCADEGEGTVWRLIYVDVILALQLFVSPFIVRSRRTYREGLLFAIATVVCAVVWIGWTTTYSVLGRQFGPHWYDVCLSSGIVATAVVILCVVFVPKVSKIPRMPCYGSRMQ